VVFSTSVPAAILFYTNVEVKHAIMEELIRIADLRKFLREADPDLHPNERESVDFSKLNSAFEGHPEMVNRALRTLELTYPDRFCFAAPTDCIPTKHSFAWSDNAILFLPDALRDLVGRCADKRFSAAIIALFDGTEGHANTLLLDRVDKVLYRFEPKGAGYNGYDGAAFDAAIGKFAREVLRVCYIPVHHTQGSHGPQVRELLEADMDTSKLPKLGACAIWSLLIINCKVHYPNLTIRQITGFLDSGMYAAAPMVQSFGNELLDMIEKIEAKHGKQKLCKDIAISDFYSYPPKTKEELDMQRRIVRTAIEADTVSDVIPRTSECACRITGVTGDLPTSKI
jgi:hypothetical protein